MHGPRKHQASLLAFVAILISAVIALIIANHYLAHPQSRQANEQDVVIRVYDIRDLTSAIPNFAPPGSPNPPASAPARDQTVAAILRAITTTIDPPSWRVNHGSTGIVEEHRDQLVITQTVANQEKISHLLDRLREPHRYVVRVETRFITSAAAEKFLAEKGESWIGSPQAHSESWPHVLSDSERNDLIHAANTDGQGAILTAPKMTLFNGQRSYITTARETAYVKDLQAVTAADGKVAFKPVIATVESGITLDCAANVSADHKYVTFTFRPRTSALLDLVRAPWKSPMKAQPGFPATRPAASQPTIQIPYVRQASLDTTVSIPDGASALFRLHSTITPNKRPTDSDPSFLVFVSASIVAPSTR